MLESPAKELRRWWGPRPHRPARIDGAGRRAYGSFRRHSAASCTHAGQGHGWKTRTTHGALCHLHRLSPRRTGLSALMDAIGSARCEPHAVSAASEGASNPYISAQSETVCVKPTCDVHFVRANQVLPSRVGIT